MSNTDGKGGRTPPTPIQGPKDQQTLASEAAKELQRTHAAVFEFEMDVQTAASVIAFAQLGLRHPQAMNSETYPFALQAVQGMIDDLSGYDPDTGLAEHPNVYRLLMLGWQQAP